MYTYQYIGKYLPSDSKLSIVDCHNKVHDKQLTIIFKSFEIYNDIHKSF